MTPLKLNEQEIAELQSVMRKQTGNAALARRARCVPLPAQSTNRSSSLMEQAIRPSRILIK
jgi:hypothetical protein